ncbi:flagellar motor protein PomA [Piscirickettsia litoralis]|uniref:Flagellar motor protein PomA n=1 Tax=Piscirickettsia litoralis TaxID=1891921 RepID=A0ABX3A200_9GAMM|nr:flagellar motor protein PomA [Piscirickettsia litoralis]ODN42262.1 flagellar motor protein PomA [Piscirickettsia litoralis]
MDLATLLGMLGAIGIIMMAMILGGDIGIFINVPSLLIVMGGSVFVVMMFYGMGQFFSAIKIAMKAFLTKLPKLGDLIEKSVELADAARKGGLLSLEGAEIPDPFMQKGIQMLVDGQEADVVRATMRKDMSLTLERHKTAQSIFKTMEVIAPAMGMIGTLIGLVQMLSNMDDPKSIGPAMAVALLTTLYGAMIANMFCAPIGGKLRLRSEEEYTAKGLVIDAVLGIQAGQNPRVLSDVLMNYLPAAKRPVEEEI